MQSISIWDYIYFGTSLRYLQDVNVGNFIHGQHFILENIESFLSTLKTFQLHVTSRASGELLDLYDQLAAKPADYTLTTEDAVKLHTIMNEIRLTLNAEATGIVAFIVTDKRIDTTRLLTNVRGLMAATIYDLLSDHAKFDLDEAGKCIAFERPTAAAFHLMRGTEAVLRAFYCGIVKRNRVNPLLWGPMVDSLRSRSRNRTDTALLDNLDNIRRTYRNPTQHPDKIYDIDEVQDLFGLCVDVIGRMVRPTRR